MRWRILLFLLRRVEPTFIRVREKLLLWVQRRDTWLRRQFLALLDPNRNEILSLLVLGLLLIGATWTFLAILEDVVSQDDLVGLDRAIYAFLRGLRTAWADRLMIVITELGDSVVTTAVAAAAILWLAWHRAWRAAAHLAAAVLFASLFNTIIKVTLHVGRPTNLYTGWTAYSFPSGHATINVALYGFLCFLIARECRPRLRSIVIGGVAIFVSMIAFSRIYLGAHWFSDVVAGVAFGLMWISLLGLVYLWHNPPRIGAERLLALVCSVLIVVGGFTLRAPTISIGSAMLFTGISAFPGLPIQVCIGMRRGKLMIVPAGKRRKPAPWILCIRLTCWAHSDRHLYERSLGPERTSTDARLCTCQFEGWNSSSQRWGGRRTGTTGGGARRT